MQNPLSTYTATQIHARGSSARAAARGGEGRRRHGRRRRRYAFGTGSLSAGISRARSCECLSLVLLLAVTAILFGFFLSRSIDTWEDKEAREQNWVKAESCTVLEDAKIEECRRGVFTGTVTEDTYRVDLRVTVTNGGSTNVADVIVDCIPKGDAEEQADSLMKDNRLDCYVAPFDEELVRLTEGFDEGIAAQAKRTAITMIILTATAGFSLLLTVVGALFHNFSSSSRPSGVNDAYRGGRDAIESPGNRRNVLTEVEAEQLVRKCRLGQEALEKLPPERNTCSVCLEELCTGVEADVPISEREERDSIVELPCSHVFHSNKCILFWLKRGNGTCPTCNFDVVSFVRNDPSFGEEESDDAETARSTERESNDSAHSPSRTEGRLLRSARNVMYRLFRLHRGERGPGLTDQPSGQQTEAQADVEQANPSLQLGGRPQEQEGGENEDRDSEPFEIVTSSPGSSAGHRPAANPRNGNSGRANDGSSTEVETRFPD